MSAKTETEQRTIRTPNPTADGSKRSAPYRFPPGLKYNLPFYAFRKFRPADPIGLFQYLADQFGDIVHYKIGRQHIVYLNDPAYMREVFVVQNDNFTKERTVRRTKLLLGEGMITAEGNRTGRNGRWRSRHFIDNALAATQKPWWPRRCVCRSLGATGSSLIFLRR